MVIRRVDLRVEYYVDGSLAYTSVGLLSAYPSLFVTIFGRMYGSRVDNVVVSRTAPPAIPSAPVLSSPSNGATGISVTPTLSWSASTGTAPITYTLQVATSNAFSSFATIELGLSGTSYVISIPLGYSLPYYWRVQATNAAGTSSWSSVYYFTTTSAPGDTGTDMGMHITWPTAGGAVTGGTFTVDGTFDTAQSQGMELLVTVGSLGTHAYNFTASGTTWLVTVNKADFPGFVNGTAYATILQGCQQGPIIPPLQTAARSVTWQTQSTASFALFLFPSWNVISVPFSTSVSLLPTCDFFLAWDGSFWQPVTTLFPGTGYLVRNTIGATAVTLSGTPSSSPQTQPATGTWQIIGNPYTTPVSFACTTSVPYLLWWDGSFWQPASPTNLPPGLGFLLQAFSPGTITLTRLP
jgi:hypothetical protein